MSLATFWAGIMGGGPGFSIQFSAANYQVNDFGIPPGDARSTINLNGNGNIEMTRLNASNGVIGTWATGTGFDPNDYDVMWQSSGSNPNWGPSDPIDTWINGSVGVMGIWGEEETGIGSSSANGTLRIRPAGGGADIDTATVNPLYAESTP